MASLHFIYGAMNCGKSTKLLQDAHNYVERGKLPMLIKPSIDNREGSAVIKSRLGSEKPCIQFSPTQDMMDLVLEFTSKNVDYPACIFVDEAQFLTPEQVYELTIVIDQLHIPVMCYGLRTDFQNKLFPGSASLLAEADRLEECRTICHCGKRASKVLRFDENGKVTKSGSQVFIGGNDSYVSVCRKHWLRGESK